MAPTASLWPDVRHGRGITSGTFYGNLRRYLHQSGLPAGGVHVFRPAATARRARLYRQCRTSWIIAPWL
jgi:hypothetical protein